MADQEVIKHLKKIQESYSSQEKSGWRKAKEMFLEIAIIVFAITLSISLHNWSEHRKEQRFVKKFLAGLREDIRDDIKETKRITNNYHRYDTLYTYLSNLDKNTPPVLDSLNWALPNINGNDFLRPNSTRFNGFQSAGKMIDIEDDSLALGILELYQENIPRIQSSEGFWISLNKELQSYLRDNMEGVDALAQWKVLTTPKGKLLCRRLIPWQQLYSRYDDFTLSGEDIIRRIDRYLEE